MVQQRDPWTRWLLRGLMLIGCTLSAHAQTLYDSGDPTAREEQIRWFHNKARFSPPSENERLSRNYSVPAGPLQPLAPNKNMRTAARKHCEDVARRDPSFSNPHITPSGSPFYTPGDDPGVRLDKEGYGWLGNAENVIGGTTHTTGRHAHEGWWNSTGHRNNVLTEEFREVGVGYFYLNAALLKHYDTVKFGRDGYSGVETFFFTDTIFNDANNNRLYEEGEGVGGITIRLYDGETQWSFYAQSRNSGSFAMPIRGLTAGRFIQVRIRNNGTARSLTFPTGYDAQTKIWFAANEEKIYKGFTQPSSPRNIGFRDLIDSPSQTVTFNANGGGTPNPTSKSVSYGSTYGTLATVSRTGYTFAGWWTAASGGTQVTSATTVTATANHTLFARWTAQYELIYRAGAGGSLDGQAAQTVEHGGNGSSVTAQPEAGAIFIGWSDGITDTPRTDLNVTSNLDVTAEFASEEGEVPIDWYSDYDIAPADGQTWSDLDQLDIYNKGMTLREEFVAGTNPNDPNSIFKILQLDFSEGKIHFEPVSAARVYRVLYCDDLTSNDWAPSGGDGPQTAPGGAIALPGGSGSTVRFYRIEVQLP